MAIKTPARPEEENIHGEKQPEPLFGSGYDERAPLGKPTDARSERSSSPEALREAEENPAAPAAAGASAERSRLAGGSQGHIGAGFNAADKFLPPQARLAGALTGLFKSKKGRAGLATGGIIGTGIFILSIFQGPLQLVHLAQTLQKNFFSQEDASDGRARSLYRWARSGDVGETRLGELGSRQFKKIQKYYADRGVELKTRGLRGHVTAMTIDLDKHPDFQGLSTQEARARIISENGLDPGRVGQIADKKLGVSLRGMSISEQRAFLKSMHSGLYKNYKLIGSRLMGKIYTALNFRILTKYFEIPSWLHPIKKASVRVDRTVDAKITAAKKRLQERQRKAKLTKRSPEAEARIVRIKKSLKIGGGIAAAGLAVQEGLCIAKDIASEVPQINRENVALPAMASAGDAIALGAQVQAGDDFKIDQVGQVVNDLENDRGENVWASKPLQATTGKRNPQGKDIDPDTKQAFSPNSTAANIEKTLDAAGADAACGTIGQVTGAVAGVALLVLGPGGWAVKAGSAAIGAAAIAAITTYVPRLIADKPLTGIPHNGPRGGSVDAYGARELANTAYRASGGSAMSHTQTAYFENKQQAQDNQDFASKSFFARMFDTQDYRSLASKAIDSSSTNPAQNIASIFGGLMNISKNAAGLFSSLLPKTFAAEEPYDWGFPRYGIPQNVLDNPRLQDPYANGDKVAKMLNGDTSDKLKNRAKKCFGVEITKQSGKWNVLPKEDVNPQSSDYLESKCNDTKLSWQRVSLFIFDTRLITSMECYDGDEDSCADIGIENTSVSTTTSTGVISGDAQQLAQQLLDNPNVTYSYADQVDGTTVEDVLKQIVKTGEGIVNSPDVSFRSVPVSTKLLKTLVEYAQSHKIDLTALTNADHSSTSNHYKGLAVDIGCSPPLDVAAFNKIASKYGGSNNGETCPGGDSHWHYDFPK